MNPTPSDGGQIESMLRQIGFPYQRNLDGDYEIAVGIAGGRTQSAHINAIAQSVDGCKILRISSVAYECDGLIAEGIANSLLALNSTTLLGAWGIQRGKGELRFLAYIAKVALGGSAETLRAALLEVADMADDIESKLSGTDRF